MSRRRKVHVNLSRDASQDEATLLRNGFVPWVTITMDLRYPPGMSRQTLLQAIGDAAVRACTEVLKDPTTHGPVVSVRSSDD